MLVSFWPSFRCALWRALCAFLGPLGKALVVFCDPEHRFLGGEDERNGRCVRRSLIPTIRDIQRHGAPSLHSIADTLNTRGIPTARGKTWTAMQVSNVMARAGV